MSDRFVEAPAGLRERLGGRLLSGRVAGVWFVASSKLTYQRRRGCGCDADCNSGWSGRAWRGVIVVVGVVVPRGLLGRSGTAEAAIVRRVLVSGERDEAMALAGFTIGSGRRRRRSGGSRLWRLGAACVAAALTVSAAAAVSSPADGPDGQEAVRIVARKLEDGRVEFGLQQRQGDSS